MERGKKTLEETENSPCKTWEIYGKMISISTNTRFLSRRRSNFRTRFRFEGGDPASTQVHLLPRPSLSAPTLKLKYVEQLSRRAYRIICGHSTRTKIRSLRWSRSKFLLGLKQTHSLDKEPKFHSVVVAGLGSSSLSYH